MLPGMIIVAPNGARRQQADHQNIPLTPQAMALCARQCMEAGAAMLHMHARTQEGEHTLDVDINRRFLEAVRDELGDDLIIQLTTEAVGRYQPSEQMHLVRALKPEAVSLAIAEILPAEQEDVRQAAEFLQWTREQRILVQYILYSPEDVARYHRLKAAGVIPPGCHHLLFVIGRHGRTEPSQLARFIVAHQDETPWATCGFGASELPVSLASLSLGGDVRVGFENNLLTASGEPAQSNASQVRQLHDWARALGRPLRNAAAARSYLLSC